MEPRLLGGIHASVLKHVPRNHFHSCDGIPGSSQPNPESNPLTPNLSLPPSLLKRTKVLFDCEADGLETVMMSLTEEVLRREEEDVCDVRGRTILIKDCVQTSGRFLLYHLIKNLLALPQTPSSLPSSAAAGLVLFLSFSEPFSHYERILKKMGCNLLAQRERNKFIFFDMLRPGSSDKGKNDPATMLIQLYGMIEHAVKKCVSGGNGRNITIMVDDISLLEIFARGNSNLVLNFLHYCRTLTSQKGCFLILLGHHDIYESMELDRFLSHMEYAADVVMTVAPLALGLASDVHGQLTVEKKGILDEHGRLSNKLHHFHFRIKENCAEYFHPGSQIPMSL